ncbi:hypothetical protein FDECE_14204 [Fusarium decemcellulare]|nr:hypothetical protein FDECE_14204 [Fusarium decemcellulare]
MDSLASQCAEEANSTDCLLRTLLKFLEDVKETDDNKFEWDPITFGFTVSIAIVAAGFALLTIVQAVLASGPGRRKSTSEAIGKWSKDTEWQWQWWNFGYLHIAKTPILTVANVSKYLASKEKEDGPEPTRETAEVTTGNLSIEYGAGAASWLIFLDKAGLSDLRLEANAMKTTLADYLPGDLVAVPAPVEVRLVFLLMAMSNKSLRVLEAGTRYPNLIGTESQFEIRQHPTLGSIGAFSSHGPTTSTWKPSKGGLELGLRHAEGAIPCSEKLFPDIRSWRQKDDINVTDRWDVSSLAISHQSTCAVEGCKDHFGKFYSFRFPSNSTGLHCFLFAGVPKSYPAAFPWSMLLINGMFEALSISGNIATRSRLKPDPEGSSKARRMHVLEIMGYLGMMPPEAKVTSIEGLIDVFREFEKSSKPERWGLPDLTRYEGIEILNALEKSFGPISLILSRIEEMMELRKDEHLPPLGKGADSLTISKSDFFTKDVRKRKPQGESKGSSSGERTGSTKVNPITEKLITRVLAWRIMLMAVLYFTAHDTAPMLSSGIWQQVLPML